MHDLKKGFLFGCIIMLFSCTSHYYSVVQIQFIKPDSTIVADPTTAKIDYLKNNYPKQLDSTYIHVGVATISNKYIDLKSQTHLNSYKILNRDKDLILFEVDHDKAIGQITSDTSTYNYGLHWIFQKLYKTDNQFPKKFWKNNKYYQIKYDSNTSTTIEPITKDNGLIADENIKDGRVGFYQFSELYRFKGITNLNFSSKIFSDGLYVNNAGRVFTLPHVDLKIIEFDQVDRYRLMKKLLGVWKIVDSIDPINYENGALTLEFQETGSIINLLVESKFKENWFENARIEISPSGRFLITYRNDGMIDVWRFTINPETGYLEIVSSNYNFFLILETDPNI